MILNWNDRSSSGSEGLGGEARPKNDWHYSQFSSDWRMVVLLSWISVLDIFSCYFYFGFVPWMNGLWVKVEPESPFHSWISCRLFLRVMPFFSCPFPHFNKRAIWKKKGKLLCIGYGIHHYQILLFTSFVAVLFCISCLSVVFSCEKESFPLQVAKWHFIIEKFNLDFGTGARDSKRQTPSSNCVP